MRITLDEDEVKNILCDFLKNKYGKAPKSMKFKVYAGHLIGEKNTLSIEVAYPTKEV